MEARRRARTRAVFDRRADVQKDRIELDVWAWRRGLDSWLVDHIVLDGGPGDAACWRKLTELLGRTRMPAMTLARLAIDTGFETSAVYDELWPELGDAG